MTFNEILKVLDSAHLTKVLLLGHHNIDPDALGSAFALQQLLKKRKPELSVDIGASEGISKLTKNVLGILPISVNLQPDVEQAEAIILLDTNTLEQLDALTERVAKSKAPLIVIDHHFPHPNTLDICRLCIADDEASSTCDIVYGFYKEQSVTPDLDVAKALFLGMAFDTRHFMLARSATFKAVAKLIEAGVDPQETLTVLTVPMEQSERIARIKASKRAQIVEVKGWILALSHVSAYQASAARALTDIGAHVAAVAGKKQGGGVEVSLRCVGDFQRKTGMHLGRDIAKPLGEALDGSGGGHAMAAGVNGGGTVHAALEKCLRLMKERLAKPE